MPLFTVTLAFIAATLFYAYYADYQYVSAETRLIQEQLKKPKEIVQVQVKHILVKTRKEAEKLRAEIIKNNSDFEKAAQEKSICPSGKSGGNLGFIVRGQMVPEFEEAAFKLPESTISNPVKTQFGWHLIKVPEIVFATD